VDVILVNSNPATNMTGPGMADCVLSTAYADHSGAIIEKEKRTAAIHARRPDGLTLSCSGKKLFGNARVQLLSARIPKRLQGGGRQLFKETMLSIGERSFRPAW
jgi:carbamoylphosphate synthase large subunit